MRKLGMSWKKVSSKTLYTHPRITLIEDTVELPNGERVPYLTFGTRADSVCIICMSGDKILLQKEYSYPPNKVLYQFPGGKVEAGENTVQGAVRELTEEAGLNPKSITEIGWFYMDNRRTSARMFVYLARNCEKIKKTGGDIEEEITSHWTSINKINEMIKNGEIVNYSLLAAWSLFKAKGSSLLA